MGRRKWSIRPVVENCIPLPIAFFCHCIAGTTGTLTWTNPASGAVLYRVDYRVAEGRIYLSRRSGLDGFEGQTIGTTTTRPHLGGQRLWFLCWCGRRAAMLYLGRAGFRCRCCYGLVYRSSRRHDPRQSRKRAVWKAEAQRLFEDAMLLSAPHDLEEVVREREQQGLPVHPELREILTAARMEADLARRRLFRGA
jgi:hypothetical protein